jgi:hypothetical protein
MPSSSIFRVSTLSAVLLLSIGATGASAQDPDQDREPIGRFAADARGIFVNYPSDEALAAFLDVTPENLAGRGLGASFGAHVYPIRLGRRIALGLGAEVFFSRGSETLEPGDDDAVAPESVTVDARLSGFSPQVSLNFGGREGWSYLSGGIGWTKFTTEVKSTGGTPAAPTVPVTPTAPAGDGESGRTSTLNYGGGARWYMKQHVAFTLDLRFYVVKPREATTNLPALPRTRLLMLSAGVSFK